VSAEDRRQLAAVVLAKEARREGPYLRALRRAGAFKSFCCAGSGPDVRVVSLIASATEIVCALDCADLLVARSHECDWPAEITRLPQASRPSFVTKWSSRAIDLAVKDRLAKALSIYEVDAELLKRLEPTSFSPRRSARCAR